MTLIMGVINSDHAIQVSDRRLTVDGKPSTEEANKALVYYLDDARLCVGFSGLATTGSFSTGTWLVEALSQASFPNFRLEPALDQLKDRAERKFRQLRSLPAKDRRLSVLFTGYVGAMSGPRAYITLLSNCERLGEPARAKASTRFEITQLYERHPGEGIPHVVCVGRESPVSDGDLEAIWKLATARKPAHAIVRKTVALIRRVAKEPKACELIGHQCTSVVLPRDPTASHTAEYHSTVIKNEHFEPAVVNHGIGVAEIHVWTRETPLAVPQVRSGYPCPCGSGLRYRRCHGRFA